MDFFFFHNKGIIALLCSSLENHQTTGKTNLSPFALVLRFWQKNVSNYFCDVKRQRAKWSHAGRGRRGRDVILVQIMRRHSFHWNKKTSQRGRHKLAL